MDERRQELLAVTVELWHPECWTLRVSGETDVGMLGNETTVHGGVATGRYTLYGPSSGAIDDAVEAVRASPLTQRTDVVVPAGGRRAGAGSVSREVLVEFDAGPSIRGAFTGRGFVHRGRTWHEGGRERRSFFVRDTREAVRRKLDEVAAAYDADVDLRRLTGARSGDGDERPPEASLSPRQREAFSVARRRGYYAYPRETTASELASRLDISKTTYLEHLRKAEAKLLPHLDAE